MAAFVPALRPRMRDRLNDRERILEAMCLVVQQHVLPLLPQFPVGDVPHALKRKLATTYRFDLNHCLDCQSSSVFRPVHEITGPNPFLAQLVRHFLRMTIRGPLS